VAGIFACGRGRHLSARNGVAITGGLRIFNTLTTGGGNFGRGALDFPTRVGRAKAAWRCACQPQSMTLTVSFMFIGACQPPHKAAEGRRTP